MITLDSISFSSARLPKGRAEGEIHENALPLLLERAEKVERGLPMLGFKSRDELAQVKLFLRTYFEPVLTQYDHLRLQDKDEEVFNESETAQNSPHQKNNQEEEEERSLQAKKARKNKSMPY